MTCLLLSSNFNATFKPTFFLFHVFISFLLFRFHGSIAEAEKVTLRIGAIIDYDSGIGKEQKTALKIAVQNFNKKSKFGKLSLHFQNPGGDPIRSAHAAEELIKEKKVQVIIGMETWEEAVLVADIANRTQVPLLSFAAAAITPPLTRLRWPFLVQMVSDGSEQINCIAAIVQSFHWPSVVAVYEEDIHGGSRKLTLLSKELKKVGSDIDYHLVLPPFSCLSKLNPREFVNKELSKLEKSTKSRVFIFLQSSLPLTNLLFSEAKKMRFMRKDSVWIIADTTASLLNSVSPPVVFAMEGALGIKPYYSEDTTSFRNFREHFLQNFQLHYPEEDKSEPGIHALRAYDSIMTITKAMMKSDGKIMSSSKLLRDSILSSNFTGLSGEVRFEEGRLSSSQKFSIVNIANQEYKKLGFWSSELGFSDSHSGTQKIGNMKKLASFSEMTWPGDPERIPGGWAPMKIAVPGRVTFKKFLTAESINSVEKYTGFCIRLYQELRTILEQRHNIYLPSPNEFHEYHGSYDDLIECVHNKTFDAAVGDITILAKRWSLVEFTEPFIESGLSMVVPVKPEASKAWLFLKPFAMEMWVATGIILIYTMLIVWFLEQRSNPEFSGPWKKQLGNVLWFTFSTLFFVHREKIKSNYTRTVVVVWLFVVLILTQSFTANLTSMLTISRLRPIVTDIEWLKKTNAKVGCACDGPTFVRNYLENVYQLKPENIIEIKNQNEYVNAFKNGSISAAFLEVPYAKVFVNQYCKQYDYVNGSFTSRFGGFGFVFQKGSPLAAAVSEAILIKLENGRLKELEDDLFIPSSECPNSQTTKDNDSLGIQGFLGLFIISATTSAVCFLLYLMNSTRRTRISESAPTSGDHIDRSGDATIQLTLLPNMSNAQFGRRNGKLHGRKRRRE